MTNSIYILHGCWGSVDWIKSEIIEVSAEPQPLLMKLAGIADTSAQDYIVTHSDVMEKRDQWSYEVTNGCGKFAGFYITKKEVQL